MIALLAIKPTEMEQGQGNILDDYFNVIMLIFHTHLLQRFKCVYFDRDSRGVILSATSIKILNPIYILNKYYNMTLSTT